MIKQMDKWLLVLMTAIIGMNTMLYRQQDAIAFVIYVGIALFAFCGAWIGYGYFEKWCEKIFTWDIKRLLIVFAVFAAVGVGILAGVSYTEGFYIFTENRNKKWLFEFMLVILFPLFCTWFAKILEKDSCMENKIAASVVIMSFQFLAFILFRPLGTIWLLWWIVVGMTTIWNMVFMISEVKNNEEVERKADWVYFYLVFWLAMYFIFGHDFDVEYQRLVNGIQDIQTNVLTFLYFALLFVFAQVIKVYLGKGRKKNPAMYLIQHAAYVNLFLRVIFGMMYWMGISPIPVRPPFASTYAMVMDSVCVAILAQSECGEEEFWDDGFDEDYDDIEFSEFFEGFEDEEFFEDEKAEHSEIPSA